MPVRHQHLAMPLFDQMTGENDSDEILTDHRLPVHGCILLYRKPARKIEETSTSAALTDLLFQVISQRYERGSIVLTPNKAFKQWPTIFNGDSTITSAVLDRLPHPAETSIAFSSLRNRFPNRPISTILTPPLAIVSSLRN
jgi:IstB-like ATP binding protein